MKTTLKEINASIPSLRILSKGKKVPPKANYAISKLAKACDNELEHYNQERHKLFVAAGCTVSEDGEKYLHETPGKVDEIEKQAKEMLEAEVELNALPLNIEQFGDAEFENGCAFYGLDWAMVQPS
jgi:hypothetical protein